MRSSLLAGMAALGVALWGGAAWGQQGFDDAKVQAAIEKGKAFLLAAQLPDGSWSADKTTGVGLTAMSAYALMECGVKPSDPKIRKSLTWLTEQECTHTYSLGLRAQCYLSAEKHGANNQYRPALRKDAELLAKTGLTNHGRYGYATPGGGSDNSNSQYGLLGVWAWAELGGQEIHESYWIAVLKHWEACQGPDGGWMYGFSAPPAGGAAATMTVAGIASSQVCYEQLAYAKFADCGGPVRRDSIERGLAWMERYFVEIVGGAGAAKAAADAMAAQKAKEAEEAKEVLDQLAPAERKAFEAEERRRMLEEKARQRPAAEKRGFAAPGGWMLYFLYGVERVGLASGYKYFGTADWYKVGAAKIVAMQAGNGSWGQLYDTAFSMIFLARGRNPVLFNKLSYRGRWNNRPQDLMNLTKWLSANAEWTVNWQTINTQVPVREWHDAPILYISGSAAPYFTPVELRKLRRFVDEGGTIVAVTECNGGAFREGIRTAFRRIFPEYEETPVPPTHDMYTSQELFPLAGKNVPAASLVSNGVRPLALRIDTDVAKAWQLKATRSAEAAFQLGSNVSIYLTGMARELRPRGASPWPEPAGKPLGGAEIRLARLKHAGRFDPEPLALERFALLMANRHQKKVTILPPQDIRALSPERVQLAILSGTGKLVLGPADTDALKKFVAGGGTLLVEAVGGNLDFARTARTALRGAFDADPVVLPARHAIYQASGFEVSQFQYRKRTQRRLARTPGPQLGAITVAGRPAVFFSGEDLSCGLLGYQGLAVDGYAPETAFAIARNLALLASGQAPAATQPATQPASQPASQPAD